MDRTDIVLERAKAKAWARLYPHLRKYDNSRWPRPLRRRPVNEINFYLATITSTQIAMMINGTWLPDVKEIDACVLASIEAAKAHANHRLVNDAAANVLTDFIARARSDYFAELDRRRRQWESCPIFPFAPHYDPDEEARVLAEIKAEGDRRRAEQDASATVAQSDVENGDTPINQVLAANLELLKVMTPEHSYRHIAHTIGHEDHGRVSAHCKGTRGVSRKSLREYAQAFSRLLGRCITEQDLLSEDLKKRIQSNQ